MTVTNAPPPPKTAVAPVAAGSSPASSAAWSTANTPGWYRFFGALAIATIAGFATVATAATLVTSSSAQSIESNVAPSLIELQGLSASVAEANAAATSVFLAGSTGGEDRTRRVLYLEALARSAQQTEEVAGLVGDDDTAHEALKSISVALTTYSGQIESSQTANELGSDEADVALRSALDLTRTEIVSAVDELTAQNQAEFSDKTNRGLILTMVAVAVGAGTAVFLVWFQLGVFHRSNRIINIGLTLATLLIIATLAVVANVTMVRVQALRNAEDGGYDSIVATSALQSSAYEVQSQLSLRLLGAESEDPVTIISSIDNEIAAVAAGVDSTRERAAAEELDIRWDRYRQTVESITALSSQGSQDEAIALFQGAGISDFNGLNTSIESVLSDNRNQFDDGVTSAAASPRLLPLVSVILPALAALAVILGVQGRLRDYQ
ncbi:MAG: hypothetical protein GY724_08820 [Actinomycetia bacterium]|nr:hypothetical protein [Actinomycetes bacterium]